MNKKRENQQFGTNIIEDLFQSIYQNRLVQVFFFSWDAKT